MERVTRHQIEQTISEETHISIDTIHKVLDRFVLHMHVAFARGSPVVVTNLGTFKVRKLNTGNGTYVAFSRSGPSTVVRQQANAMVEKESETSTKA